MALIRERKLSKQQLRRIKEQQRQGQISDNDALMDGIVMAHYGKQLEVQVTSLPHTMPDKPLTAEGEPEPFWQPICLHDIWRCYARTNLPMLATGDKVRWTADPNTGLGRIEAAAPRKSLISRPDRYHRIKPVASNIDLLAIVFAPLPLPAFSLIDRYLVVCHHAGITPLLILNKADMLVDDKHQQAQHILQDYAKLGYTTLMTSAEQPHTSSGIDDLDQLIRNKMVIFAGQSGVGKSTLINAILPDAEQRVNVISENSKLGQHTTTTSRFLPFIPDDLTQGGIVDTPGIREYGIWHLTPNDIMAGFVELSQLAGGCQFRDCQHTQNSKGCALWQAVSAGHILARRVESLIALQAEADTKNY